MPYPERSYSSEHHIHAAESQKNPRRTEGVIKKRQNSSKVFNK